MMLLTINSRDRRIAPSLLAVGIALALHPGLSIAAADTDDTIIVEGTTEIRPDAQQQDYSVKTTTTGTKLLLVQRDIPQSVSVISQQRMQDQELNTIEQVLDNTTGVSASRVDTHRTNFYSRGFFVSNFAYEDMPTFLDNRWNFGDAAGDTAIYDKIEVVRGAAGLMSGTGNPSAYVNMVRKHADSKEFKGSVSATYGSWNNQRYVLDLQAPLTESGNVRGRVITGYQDKDSWVERNHYRKKFIYGVVDADVTDSTTLSLGYDYQESEEDSPTWGGFPSMFSDGSKTHFRRGFNTAADWTYSNVDSTKIFANLTQRFDNGWEAKINTMHAETNFDSKLMYIDGYPDKATGLYDASKWYGAWGGWNKGQRKQDSVDAFVRGGYNLLGRQHEVMFGGSYSRQRNNYDNAYPVNDNYGLMDVGSIYDYNGKLSDPAWSNFALYQRDVIRQKSLYAASRISLADPLHLILGARYTEWSAKYNLERQPDEIRHAKFDDVTPYAGLIYDIDDTWSVYASYTSIFQPTGQRDINSVFLDPTTGKSYETGVKGDWFDTRLTATVSLFRIEQDNVAVNTGTTIPGSGGQTAYKSVDGTVSKGIEFELNGALTDNWQLTFGGSRYVAEDEDGNAVNPSQPRTSLKLFTRYQLPVLPALTIGGGARWQNKTWQELDNGPNNVSTITQSGYTIIDLFTRYQVSKNFAVQGNVNNLFDKEYYDYLGSYGVYGAPRNFSVNASYSF
ncbi:ferric-rhodotorulic acid/ferric-coprogen receptor FhuE [Raoultella ornithinolytica]|uniref:ferric-rhodotorulic acid/ferric-coprogen receptor FhuE n=1 Tax=Raoultella TaxID=160674 RepID=UPI0009C06871|nr:ferric-rhodotorulic acid/ferric-coprogen receptor FhuE [Raoultella ornithinolytica]APB05346.2 ferric-rhodotorulic acid/ferric-coprogen receptor FhuE [Raoultella ornithinolytica]ELS5403548.1 ferric-rhodotorulic acid/ferric-coprogen receptor FhuE [Raoultella ornithinolytica]ELS5458766.1 ferric-rhodotorulic acid/ferric-coprogen receptor FhuE [Raoultella ornithinolytica]ELS5482363.1 ferric-rhodotorulic acid/ferric-coprogen receptor FhuE [Raoultella ornithinolytica]MCE9800279.1 ferric-rhodotorul